MSSKFKIWFKDNCSSSLIILGIISGMICGFILKSIFTISPIVLTYIGLPGTIVIRAFMLLIVPLIVSSLSTSIAVTKRDQGKRLIYFSLVSISLSLLCVSTFGVIMTMIIKPGVRQDLIPNEMNSSRRNQDVNLMIISQDEVIYDVFMNLVPDNAIGTTLMTQYTALIPINAKNLSEGYKKVTEKSFKPNMLGLCAFSLVLGFAIFNLEQRAITIRTLLLETNAITMDILKALLIVMPLGMFSWMCVEAIKMKSPGQIIVQLAWFAFTALFVFMIMWIILYPAIYYLFVRKNPYKLYYNLIPAILLAVGSGSSAITLPETMRCMEEKNKLAIPISHFFLPLGMTMHMPGPATYYPMVAVFVAQMHGITPAVPLLVALCIYSVVQAMAFPAAPSHGGGLVFYVIMCSMIGVESPFEILAYIMTIDWLMCRVRTATNVTMDCMLAPIVEKFCHNSQTTNELQEMKIETTRL